MILILFDFSFRLQVRDGFSPVSLLSNPMALFALAGCFFIFIMPKILGSMGMERRVNMRVGAP